MYKTHHEDFGRGLAEWHTLEQGGRERLFFLGASGHAVSTYPFFLKRFAGHYDVVGLENRAMWPGRGEPTKNDMWSDFIADYEAFLEFNNVGDGELIHVGHSLGASLGALLALKRPEKFKRLVMVEPGMIPTRWLSMVYRSASFKQRSESIRMKRTSSRQDKFPDKESFMQSMRTKQTYQNFTEEAMQDYADGGLVQDGDQYRLKFSGKWEAHIFCDVYYLLARLTRLKVPTLLLFAENSNLMTPERYEKYSVQCQKKNPNITMKLLDGVSHLAVQDNPDLVAKAALDWLAQ